MWGFRFRFWGCWGLEGLEFTCLPKTILNPEPGKSPRTLSGQEMLARRQGEMRDERSLLAGKRVAVCRSLQKNRSRVWGGLRV